MRENPADPGGRQISLRVVVLPATTGDRARDPLFYFTGGPGGAATLDVGWAASAFAALRDRHDLVFVDQRGTNGSSRLSCSGSIFAGITSESQIPPAVATCLEAFAGKADPKFFSTPLGVDDFDQAREALGYDKIDVYGVSYGVSSGLAYMQRHGDHVRAALFDSGSLLDVRLWQRAPLAEQAALDRLFAECRADAACAAAIPNPQADWAAVTARLARGPVELQVVDPSTDAFVKLDLVTFLGAVVDNYLASTPKRGLLLRDVHRAAAGDWTAIAQLFANGTGMEDMLMMAWTVKCSDEWAALDQSVIAGYASQSTFTPLVTGQAQTTNLVCAAWPKADGVRDKVKSTAPVVFLNGTADPVDPPVNVAGVEADMPNSLVVPVEGTGHWQLAWDTTGCLADEASTFLAVGQRSALNLWRCASMVPMPPLVVG